MFSGFRKMQITKLGNRMRGIMNRIDNTDEKISVAVLNEI